MTLGRRNVWTGFCLLYYNERVVDRGRVARSGAAQSAHWLRLSWMSTKAYKVWCPSISPLLSVYAHPTSLIWTVYACGGGGTKVGQLYFLLLVAEAIPSYQLVPYLHNYIKKLWWWHSVDDISVLAMKTAVIYAPVDLERRKKNCIFEYRALRIKVQLTKGSFLIVQSHHKTKIDEWKLTE